MDLAGRFFTDLDEANRQHATTYGAILIALIDKGVLTEEDYDRAYIQAQHIVSQEYARKRDAAEGDPE